MSDDSEMSQYELGELADAAEAAGALEEENDELRKELLSMNRWLPMETAPKDGTVIIARCDNLRATAVQYRDGMWFRENGACFSVMLTNSCLPECWMPMPINDSEFARAKLPYADMTKAA